MNTIPWGINQINLFSCGLIVYGGIISHRKEMEMTKSELIARIVNTSDAHAKAVQKTVDAKIMLNNATLALTEKVNSIYTSRDIKELGSNAEIRNANIAKETAEESNIVHNLNNVLENAKAQEAVTKLQFDQMKYIVRLLEVSVED